MNSNNNSLNWFEVPAADIKRAFAVRVDPEKLITVVVGTEAPERAAAAPQ